MRAAEGSKRVLVTMPPQVRQWLEQTALYNGSTLSGETVPARRANAWSGSGSIVSASRSTPPQRSDGGERQQKIRVRRGRRRLTEIGYPDQCRACGGIWGADGAPKLCDSRWPVTGRSQEGRAARRMAIVARGELFVLRAHRSGIHAGRQWFRKHRRRSESATRCGFETLPRRAPLAGGSECRCQQLPAKSFDRAAALADNPLEAQTWRRAVRLVQREDVRARHSLETPQSLLPLPTGRKIRVARNPTQRHGSSAVAGRT